MRSDRPPLGLLLAALLLVHGVLAPARCLTHALADPLAWAVICGHADGPAGPADAPPHAADMDCPACAACAALAHATPPAPAAIAPIAWVWVVAPPPGLEPAQGPAPPRAPPLLPRAPPPLV